MSVLEQIRQDQGSKPLVLKQDAVEARHDQWVNPYSGLGTARDKAMSASFWWNGPIPDPELMALYYNNDIAAKIIELLPKEVFRAGFELDGDSDEGDLLKWIEDSHVETAFLEAWNLARAFGGAILWVGVADGKEPWEETDLDEAESFNFLIPMDRRYVHVNRYYTDPNDPKYGQPMLYMVGDPTTAMVALIHESRVIRFDGVKVDRRLRQILRGWGLSVLQRPYEVLADFGQSFQAVTNLMIDANQAVFKFKGLIEQLAQNPTDVQTRVALTDLMRSAARAVMIDSDGEEFERTSTNFGGIGDILDKVMTRCAAAADTPKTLLFGEAAKGINNGGDSDLHQWYDKVRVAARQITTPFMRLVKIGARQLDLDPDAIKLTWNNPDQPSAAEAATIRLQTSQADASDITAQILTPEEVAIARYGSGKYSTETSIDVKSRKASLKLTLAAMADPEGEAAKGNPKAAPPPPPPGPDGEPPAPNAPPEKPAPPTIVGGPKHVTLSQEDPNAKSDEPPEGGPGRSPVPEAVGNLSGSSVGGKPTDIHVHVSQGMPGGPDEESGPTQQTRAQGPLDNEKKPIAPYVKNKTKKIDPGV